jgi:uncharacterized membrane protein YiaA
MLAVGLWNSDMALSEKGFYGLGYAMTLFAAIAVQKNVRDQNAVAGVAMDTNSSYSRH